MFLSWAASSEEDLCEIMYNVVQRERGGSRHPFSLEQTEWIIKRAAGVSAKHFVPAGSHSQLVRRRVNGK